VSRLSSNPGRSVRYAFHRALHQTVYAKIFADLWDGLGATLVVITEVRDMTPIPPSWARSLISSSVIPSVKYSWPESLERFSKGNTAMELIRFARGAAAALPFDDPIRHHVALDDFTQRQEARLWQDLAPRPPP